MEEKKVNENQPVGKPTDMKPYHRRWGMGLGGILFLILVLVIGIMIGSHARNRFAQFGYGGMHDRDYGYFNRQVAPMMGAYGMHSGFRQATTGTISAIAGNNITVDAANGISQTIAVTGATQIVKSGAAIKFSDLKQGQTVTVYGAPNAQNQIDATLIQAQ